MLTSNSIHVDYVWCERKRRKSHTEMWASNQPYQRSLFIWDSKNMGLDLVYERDGNMGNINVVHILMELVHGPGPGMGFMFFILLPTTTLASWVLSKFVIVTDTLNSVLDWGIEKRVGTGLPEKRNIEIVHGQLNPIRERNLCFQGNHRAHSIYQDLRTDQHLQIQIITKI